MKCPACGGKGRNLGTSIRVSKRTGIEYQWRQRKCYNCGIVFSTYELRDDEFRRLIGLYKSVVAAMTGADQ